MLEMENGKNITRGAAERYSGGASKERREHADGEGGRRLLVSLYSGPRARLISTYKLSTKCKTTNKSSIKSWHGDETVIRWVARDRVIGLTCAPTENRSASETSESSEVSGPLQRRVTFDLTNVP